MNYAISEDVVKLDCILIMEAIRRLREGTWNLQDEDFEHVVHLAPQVHAALLDHIEYEERCILPSLSEDEAAKHKKDHNEILALLWGIERSWKARSVVRFHVFLDMLIERLTQHHAHYSCNCNDKILGKCLNSVLDNCMFSRIQQVTLESN